MSEKKNNYMEFWIQVWAMGLIVSACSRLFAHTFGPFVVEIWLGFYLFLHEKRTQKLRRICLYYSAFAMLIGAFLIYVFNSLEPNFYLFIHFLISTPFFIGLFTFLLMPDVKKAFGPPTVLKPLPELSRKKRKRIVLWVRIFAIVMIVERVTSYVIADWYQARGFPREGVLGVLLGVICGIGLIFFQRSISRKFAMFVCLLW